MKIIAENLGKRFNFHWIFRNHNYTLQSGNSYAIIGHNGSGKSTLIQTLIGLIPISEGKLGYEKSAHQVSADDIYKEIVIAAPYLELIEEFTLQEQINFHFKFKKLKSGVDLAFLPELLWLDKARHKEIRFFSSGMKQRLKLGLAFFSDTPILVLDEPTSNLDRTGIDWYKAQIPDQQSRLILIGSNQEEEYEFCKEKIMMG